MSKPSAKGVKRRGRQLHELLDQMGERQPANDSGYDDPKRKIKVAPMTEAQGHYLISLEANQVVALPGQVRPTSARHGRRSSSWRDA